MQIIRIIILLLFGYVCFGMGVYGAMKNKTKTQDNLTTIYFLIGLLLLVIGVVISQ